MDLDVVMRSSDCPYIVQFYGALFREVSPPVRVQEAARLCAVSPVLVSVPGRLLDLYGTNGYLARQVLQICVLFAKRRDSRGDIRKNNASSKCCAWRVSRLNVLDSWLLSVLQTVKALNHLKENLKIIHRGEDPPGGDFCRSLVTASAHRCVFSSSQTSSRPTSSSTGTATSSCATLASAVSWWTPSPKPETRAADRIWL